MTVTQESVKHISLKSTFLDANFRQMPKCYDQEMIDQNYESALMSMWNKHTQETWAQQGWSVKTVELDNLRTQETQQVWSVKCGEFHPI